MSTERFLGLPAWHRAALAGQPPELLIPAYGLAEAEHLAEHFGRAAHVGLALALSGQHGALLAWRTPREERILKFGIGDFASLWTEPASALERLGAEPGATIRMWLENTTATLLCETPPDEVHALSQRNGVLYRHTVPVHPA